MQSLHLREGVEIKTDLIETNLREIKNLLRGKNDTPFNFVQAAKYLSISQSHLYKLTSHRKIPFHKPTGKYLYFFKNELDLWIVNNSKLEDGKASFGTESLDLEKEEENEPP
ncbi:MAG: helix-turn-helix domain-containing protein [Ignavibacteriaceae bacterium]